MRRFPLLAGRVGRLGLDLGNLLGGNSDGSVQGYADTGKKRGQEVSLVAFDVSQEATGLESSTAFAGQNEGQVVTTVFVAVFQARPPHHDTVVEQSAFSFLEGMHLLYHVCVLVDVEFVDLHHFADLFLILAVVCLRVVLVGESQLGVGSAVRTRTDVSADTRGIGLKREDG